MEKNDCLPLERNMEGMLRVVYTTGYFVNVFIKTYAF